MATISSSDNLFATAYVRGMEIFRFSGSGISDISEIVSKIRNHPAAMPGMVTITIRNSSRGWSQSQAIYLA